MSNLERIKKKVRRQQVSKPDSDPKSLPVEHETDSDNSSWNLEELQGNRNEEAEFNSDSSENIETSKLPTEVEGFNADASVGGISYVPIPPTNQKINTTTLQQTIISSLDPVSVHQWEQETRALENAGVINSPSRR